jgi:guanosine-3',5'-bis(diphosphate) 3'-pyrophosphohydrolase
VPVSAGKKYGLTNLAEFIIAVETFNSNINVSLLKKAYQYAERAHQDQKRISGDPYMLHSVQAALILAEQHLDSATIAAGLLHDVVEDTDVTIEDVEREFGKEIAELVDGVTRISTYSAQSVVESQAENFRKMLLSMAHDIRVILIKLADRLHNMRTLSFLPQEKQKRIASETYEVYAPLANRFGMAKIKWELEDLSLKYLNPDRYNYIMSKINETVVEREAFIAEIVKPLSEAFEKAGLKASIKGRAKSIDSISRKMELKGREFEEIYDLFAIRIIVDTVGECYMALGLVHQILKPSGIGFDDYIANPKGNGYQSLHTNVIGPKGRLVEIQIRTRQMHYTAEFGIASHWLYKEGKKEVDPSDKQFNWLREVLDWQKDMTNPAEFLEYLKIDLFHDEVFVFTPQGELKHLPANSTPLDFAFAVHTNVGLHCSGSRLNGKLVPLDTKLTSGDEVEILTSPNQEPSRDWLTYVQTSKARSKIKRFLRQKGFEQSVILGKEMLEKSLRKKKVKFPTERELTDCAHALSFSSLESLYAAIGQGDVSVLHVQSKLYPVAEEAPKQSRVKSFLDRARGSKGIRIQGLDNMMFRFAQCCQPVPGEKIIGFITRGRGISIHRADCAVALKMTEDAERLIDVEWDVSKDDEFLVRIEMVVEDRKNVLRDILDSLSTEDVNIRDAGMKSHEGYAQGMLVIEIRNLSHLERVLDKIRRTKGVQSVWRSQGGKDEL